MAPSSCWRALYWIPVIFISLIVAWSYYAYVWQLCRETITDKGKQTVYLLVYHVLFSMLVWSYWQTIFTAPMNPLKEFHLSHPDKELLEREERESQQEVLKRIAEDLPIYTSTPSGAIRYCDHCQLLKPDRCHHCSACDMCILKMDHHCPWVNNCVGFANYKFFLLFLAYSLLYCIFISVTDFQYFIQFWTKGLPDTQAKFHIMFLFFTASTFSLSLAFLFAYHCWLVCKNRSTLVFQHGPDKNGFSLGANKNFRQVFGDEKKLWLLPVFSSLGDGCSFPSAPANLDPEQPFSGLRDIAKINSASDSYQIPPEPLRESQSCLLSVRQADTSDNQEPPGTSDPALTIEKET
ncbi:hypothetical protein DNTS_006271 [Danionella cerebrum]|uniref:Palmitoyltransferase n=1 Tax=Danionella cerebrum TaxID=2873325 RepID=A0A553QFI6_9TELE|nr:hypothetical protein DNTS_006271 [Danionella translucida]